VNHHVVGEPYAIPIYTINSTEIIITMIRIENDNNISVSSLEVGIVLSFADTRFNGGTLLILSISYCDTEVYSRTSAMISSVIS